MAGRNVAFVNTIAGRCALSVNDAGMPTPPGWAWTRLGDIARLESGHTPSRSHPEYWDGDIAWIGIKDARENHARTIHDTSQHVTQAGIDNSAARLLPANTVCLSRTASVGYVTIMGRPMATSQDFVNWICSAAIEPEYLKWIFLAEGQEGLRKFGKGSTHTTIYFPEVEAFHVAVAPINEQRRIVAKLDAVFDQTRAAKARLERLPAMLEKLKRSILAAAFRGDLTADWRAANPDVEPASALLDRIRTERRRRWEDAIRAKGKDPTKATYEAPEGSDSAGLRALPDGWTWSTIGELCDVGTGATPLRGEPSYWDGGVIPWITSGATNNEFIETAAEFVTERALRETNLTIFPSGTLIIAMYGEGQTRGRCAELRLAATTNQAVAGLVTASLPDSLKDLIKFVLWDLYDVIRTEAAGGVQNNLNLSIVRGIVVPLPPLEEQLILIRRLRDATTLIATEALCVERACAGVYRMEQSALAKAFRGELVQQDPTDEPASVLLGRIRAERVAEPESPRRGRLPRQAPPLMAVPLPTADEAEVRPRRPGPTATALARPVNKHLEALAPTVLQMHVFDALWGRGPLKRDEAIRFVAEHLRDRGAVAFQRLRADGPLYAQVQAAVTSAVKEGLLDRPRRGLVRAVKHDAQSFTADDWRLALGRTLDEEPTDREDAIRTAAEWARDDLGLEFARLRADGHIVQGLRSAINSAIRRGDVVRADATRIARARVDHDRFEAGIDLVAFQPPTIEHSTEPRQIDGSESVLVLQFRSNQRDFEIQSLVASTLAATVDGAPSGASAWVFYLGLERPHVEGLSSWLGVGKGVPPELVDRIQMAFEATGSRVMREYAVAARHELAPFVAFTQDGLEVPLVGPTAPDDHALEDFEVAKIVRRPFVLDLTRIKKQDALAKLMPQSELTTPAFRPEYVGRRTIPKPQPAQAQVDQFLSYGGGGECRSIDEFLERAEKFDADVHVKMLLSAFSEIAADFCAGKIDLVGFRAAAAVKIGALIASGELPPLTPPGITALLSLWEEHPTTTGSTVSTHTGKVSAFLLAAETASTRSLQQTLPLPTS